MGTRGMYGFYRDGQTKATYNHYDSYPEELGNKIANFILETSNDEMNMIFDKIILVDENQRPTEEQIRESIAYFDDRVSTGSVNDWYALLRETQGNLNVYKYGLRYMIDSQDFILNSLFCEWAYIINLETNRLEVYKGFQKEADNNRYYHVSLEGSDFKNCRLIVSIDFDSDRLRRFEEIVEANINN